MLSASGGLCPPEPPHFYHHIDADDANSYSILMGFYSLLLHVRLELDKLLLRSTAFCAVVIVNERFTYLNVDVQRLFHRE